MNTRCDVDSGDRPGKLLTTGLLNEFYLSTNQLINRFMIPSLISSLLTVFVFSWFHGREWVGRWRAATCAGPQAAGDGRWRSQLVGAGRVRFVFLFVSFSFGGGARCVFGLQFKSFPNTNSRHLAPYES